MKIQTNLFEKFSTLPKPAFLEMFKRAVFYHVLDDIIEDIDDTPILTFIFDKVISMPELSNTTHVKLISDFLDTIKLSSSESVPFSFSYKGGNSLKDAKTIIIKVRIDDVKLYNDVKAGITLNTGEIKSKSEGL